MFTCDICQKGFTNRCNMLRHKRSHIQKDHEVCKDCNKSFSSKYNLNQHRLFACKSLPKNISTKHKGAGTTVKDHQEDKDFVEVETALKTRIKTFRVKTDMNGDLPTVFNQIKTKLSDKIRSCLRYYSALKFNIFVECEFVNSVNETSLRSFKTKNTIVYKTSDLDSILNTAFEKLSTEKSECAIKGSGWSFQKIVKLELRINKYNPLKGARYIPLPPRIENTKSVVNVQNVDEYCFKYAMLSKYCDPKNACRVSSYINNNELEIKYNWNNVSFPVRLDEIKTFEKANKVSVNIFGLDESDKVYPIKVCDVELEDHTDLLYVMTEESSHYCYIKSFDRLVHSQITKRTNRLRICKRCFTSFHDLNDLTAEERLQNHTSICKEHKSVRCEFPEYDTIRFKNDHRSKKVRFVIYADFEAILQPISSCSGDPDRSWSSAYQHHVPYSYSYLLKDNEDEYTKLREYRGENAGKHFMESIVKDVQFLDRILYGDKKLDVPRLTDQQQEEFDETSLCHICKRGDFSKENCKVRNHCHITGDYIGVAHRQCNLFYQDQHFIPCFVHNLSGYDSHFIVRELGYDTSGINVIPNTEERYVSFSKKVKVKHATYNFMELRFLDSFRFMPSSLSTLANNLPKEEFKETKNHFKENLNLVMKKGIYPYEYITSLTILNETKLPPKAAFYSHLNNEEITDEMYEHAKTVWQLFNVQTLGEYSDIYVKTDVLILCDVFENFRNTCIDTYNIDPAYYFTVPGFAFDAMLKYTGIELELIKDMDMFLMVEKGIRGGITQCVKRHSEANNKDFIDNFNPEEPSKYLWYVDANNLYGWAMSQSLPYGAFEWCDVSKLDVTNISEDSEKGYILEVDLEYPTDLHDNHSDFPFCTETKVPPGGKTNKLLATLEDKHRYVIHYRALQQALEHGLVLKKIYRAISFNQSKWLKQFVDLNTKKRTEATNDFEKDLFKLMTNSIYGKTMEQVRNRLDIRLISDPLKAEKLIAKTNFIDRTVYSENLVSFHMGKTRIVFNKPTYIGMSILDLSKTKMYSFHYDIMQPLYSDNLKLCYQDTDSFIYEIKTNDLYEDLKQVQGHLDTSDYQLNHPLHSLSNKKTLGKFKDEAKGEIVTDFVGLRSKMYAIKIKDTVVKKIKGIKKSVIDKNVHFEDYLTCLYHGGKTYSCNNFITSNKHVLNTVKMNKITLCPKDDKRVILEDLVNTLPYGHWRLNEKMHEDGPPTKKIRLQ